MDAQVKPREYVEKRFAEAIKYYWQVAGRNKRAYKWSRLSLIVLGSLVTLVASLSSSTTMEEYRDGFAIATPILAAVMTMLSGFSQGFQWGASWREMALTAEVLEARRDQIIVQTNEQLDAAKALAFLNQTIQRESSGFFDRVMGSGTTHPTSTGEPAADEQKPE